MTHTRRNFSNPTKRQAFERSNGICECHRLPGHKGCGRPVGPGNTWYEHINPDALGGLNDLDNCAVLTKTCGKARTFDHNIPTIAKSNRVRDRARGINRDSYRPLPGSKRSGIKLHINRPPTWRDSGRPLHERR